MNDGNGRGDGPDFLKGVDPASLEDGGILRGHVDREPALLVRRGCEYFIVGAECTHYHGPLGEGLLVGETLRCPWHHACFSIRDGGALCAPAFDGLPAWRVEWAGDKLFARARLSRGPSGAGRSFGPEHSIVIVGAGAAGFAAAHTLRDEGYDGRICLIGADPAAPYDRPNLSKDYLAGTAPPEWLPLRDVTYYTDQGVDLRAGHRAESIDVKARRVLLQDGEALGFDSLLLATGAEPIRLPTPGADLPHVHYLRSLADSDAIIEASKTATRALVIGASFIGLEVAAALRIRGLEVHVAAPEAVPMERVLGARLAQFVAALHARRGVRFHLGQTVASIGGASAVLASGETIDADLVVIGVGVRPCLALAETAGLAIERGVLVDEYLETSASGIYAAGDIARWPDPLTGERIRVEHWVVAERQGQTAARNMLGKRERFTETPFFWSQHYDMSISYVGHAASWDRTEISGDPDSPEGCAVSFFKEERKLAVATLLRDSESLAAEAEFQKAMAERRSS